MNLHVPGSYLNIHNMDIEKLAEIFDTIITSPNPAVQKSFQNLMVLAELSKPEDADGDGPFADMYKTVTLLREEFRTIRRDIQILQNQVGPKYTSQSSYAYDPPSMAGIQQLTASQISGLTLNPIPVTIDLSSMTHSLDLFSNAGITLGNIDLTGS